MAVLFALPFALRVFNLDRYSLNPLLWEAMAVVVLLNCAAVLFNLLPVPPLDGFGILAPLLNHNTRALLYSFSMFGFFIVFILFATNPSIRAFFLTTMDNMLHTLKVDPALANQGLFEFMFWRS